ncbi:MAG: hypothetical protein AAB578_07025, partial [Elusimicrobiota bacterium]
MSDKQGIFSSGGAHSPRWLHPLLALGAYSVIVAWLHRDLILDISSQVLAGARVGGVFLWELWWHKSGFSAYSPFLHGYTTILMHPQGTPVLPHSPMVLALGWVLQTSMNPYAAHNVLHLAAYVGSG